MRGLLSADDFVRYCTERNLRVTRERLHRLEVLRAFRPLVRIDRGADGNGSIYLDGLPAPNSFWDQWIIESYSPFTEYSVPEIEDNRVVPLYSAFQVWDLDDVLRRLNYEIELDWHLEPDAVDPSWEEHMERVLEWTEKRLQERSSKRRAEAALAQYISNAYLPSTLSNRRTIHLPQSSWYGGVLAYDSDSWDWYQYRENWDSEKVAERFGVTQDSLMRAHRGLRWARQDCDPLFDWSNMVQFVSHRKRAQLRGDALRAQLFRQMAGLFRSLFEDLYEDDVESVDKALGIRLDSVPEAKVQQDPRLHLE